MLVGSAKPELLGNKEALAAVTEELLILAEAADDMTLKDVVNASTLAMNMFGVEANRTTNVLAAGSKAGAANVSSIAKALKNSGVAAASANISLEETVGAIETLAEKGIKDEMAGTGLKTFFLKLQQGADEFNPKIVGMQTALRNLKAEQMGANEMIAMFGLEAYSVAQTLVDGAERVEHFTKSVTGTSVATEQGVTNTKTAAASLQQTLNALKLEAMDMIKHIEPLFVVSTNGVRYLVSIVPPLVKFFKEYGVAILSLAAAYAGYNAALKVSALWAGRANMLEKVSVSLMAAKQVAMAGVAVVTNTFAGKTFAAKRAMVAFNTAIKMNPIGLLVAALSAAGTALYFYGKNALKAATEEGVLSDFRLKAKKSISDEKAALTLLLSTAKNERLSIEERQEAIRKLNELSPQYLGNLKLENIMLDSTTQSVDAYTAALERNAMEKAATEKWADLHRKQMEMMMEEAALQKRFEDAVVGSESYRIIEGQLWRLKERRKALEDESALIVKISNKLKEEHEKKNPIASVSKDSPTTPTTSSSPLNADASEAALKRLEETHRQQMTLVKQQYIEGKMTEAAMQDELAIQEIAYLKRRMEMQQQYGKSYVDTEGQIADKTIALAKARVSAMEKNGVEEIATPELNTEMSAAELSELESLLVRKMEMEDEYRAEDERKAQESEDRKMAIRETALGAVSSIADSAVTLLKVAQSKEEKAIEEKYKYKLLLAEGDNEATAEIEAQKEEELLAVRKKYADKAFAFQVLSITAETAVAAMRAYSAALEIPVAGLALAPIMAAAAVAAGAAQIAVANQQREQAAQMWSGGFTGEGGKYEKKKLIQTHGGEFVATKETVNLIRPVFDIMDYAQRTGNLRALDAISVNSELGMRNWRQAVRGLKLILHSELRIPN